MILQLDPPVQVRTPRGDGLAVLVIDYGIDWDLLWTVFLDVTGESWTFRNHEIRAVENVTYGRYRQLEGIDEG